MLTADQTKTQALQSMAVTKAYEERETIDWDHGSWGRAAIALMAPWVELLD